VGARANGWANGWKGTHKWSGKRVERSEEARETGKAKVCVCVLKVRRLLKVGEVRGVRGVGCGFQKRE
jgi:hypothetical protein